jgi:hypothetical protein
MATGARLTELKTAAQHIPQLVTLKVLAERWSLPLSWLHHSTRNGAVDPLPIVRLGRYCRVDLADPALAQWLNRRRVGR